MIWSEFKAKVNENLLEHATRIGTTAFVSNLIRSGVIDLQEHIESLRSGHKTVYGQVNLVESGKASIGTLPEKAEAREMWIVATGHPVSRRPLAQYPWGSRHDLFNSDICDASSSGLVAFDPRGRNFVVWPKLLDGEHLEVAWDGQKIDFADADDVPFGEEEALAVSMYVRWKLSLAVERDEAMRRGYKLEYQSHRTALYIKSRRRTSLTSSPASPQTKYGAAHPQDSSDTETEVVFVGQTGNASTTDTEKIAALLLAQNADAVILGGDLGAPTSTEVALQEQFTKFYGALVKSGSLYVAVGSLDLDSDLAQDVVAAIPGMADLNSGKLYYTFTVGYIQFFALNGNRTAAGATAISADGVGAGSAQDAWLQAQLTASKAKWKVVVLNHSPYSSDSSINPGVTQWRLNYSSYGADLVLSAKASTYERLMVGGFNYVVCGLGGAAIGSYGSLVTGSQARYNAKCGVVRMTATDTRMNLNLINVDGDVVDAVVFTKES